MKPEQEVRARHILVETEDEAKKAYAASRAARTSPRWRTSSRRIPARRPMAAISAGSPRTAWCRNSPTPPSSWSRARSPSRSRRQFGWHVIKVEEKRTKPVPTFEQMKDQIEQLPDAQDAAGPHPGAARRRPRSSASTSPPTPAEPASAPSPPTPEAGRAGDSPDRAAAGRGGTSPVAPACRQPVAALRESPASPHVRSPAPPSPHRGLPWPSRPRLPARARSLPGPAADRRRAPRDRRGRASAIKGRTDVLLVRLRPRARRSAGVLHPLEMPVGAGRLVPRRLWPGGTARALVVNSGNANAFTGKGRRGRARSPPTSPRRRRGLRARGGLPRLDRRDRRAARRRASSRACSPSCAGARAAATPGSRPPGRS